MRRLLIRPGAIGDCIVSLPSLESLRADYTEIWVARQNVPLILFADRVRAIADTGLDLLEIPGQPADHVIETLRQFDDIVSWYGAARSEFVARIQELGLPVRFFPALPDGSCHAVDFYAAQVGAPAGLTPRIRLGNEVGPIPGPSFAAIHPFSGSRAKNWPLDRFHLLAAKLQTRIAVRWTVGPEEYLPEAERFDNLADLARWLAAARLFVGNDSGIAHLAAAAGTPVVAVFGPTDPAVWAPRGDRVIVVHETGGLANLGVDAVWAAVVECIRCEPSSDFS